MTYWLRLLFIAGLLFAAPQTHAQGKTKARLLLSHQTAKPGETVMAGIEFKIRPFWHIYWRNQGESGIPTKIEWTLPKGVTVGEIQWPIPEKTKFLDATTYEYHNEMVLLVPVTVTADAPAGILEIAAKVTWLECEPKGSCVPGKSEVSAELTVANESKPAAEATLLEEAKKKLPQTMPMPSVLAGWEKPAQGESRPLVIEWDLKDKMAAVDFYPYPSDVFEVVAATDTLSLDGGKARLRKLVKKTGGNWPTNIAGLLIQKLVGQEQESAFEVSLSVPMDSETSTKPVVTKTESSLLLNLWLGFLGGMILNIMPCVFPVIALKVLGFVQQSKEASQRVFKLGLIYALGVIASFLVLAALVIAGRLGGWGDQMKNPQFSVVLLTLVTLVALNLFGLFEVNLGSSAMGAASQLAYKEGGSGAFFNGIFTVVLATPCTAPFLASAVGFAFAKERTTLEVLLVFLSFGVGLSFPYVLLSWKPVWVAFLPKPGAWMEKFKIAMGFPMLATAIWLFSFTAKRFGEDGPLWLGLFLVIVSLAVWVWGEFVQRGTKRKGLAMAVSLLLLGLGYVYALEGELDWRMLGKTKGIVWQKWSPDALAKARAEGHPVLVDFTADWCLTCQANKRYAIEIPTTRAKLKEINAIAMIGDNTDEDKNPEIAAELKKYQRAGVPLVLVYPRDTNKPPIVLPTSLVFPANGPQIVLDALDQAVK